MPNPGPVGVSTKPLRGSGTASTMWVPGWSGLDSKTPSFTPCRRMADGCDHRVHGLDARVSSTDGAALPSTSACANCFSMSGNVMYLTTRRSCDCWAMAATRSRGACSASWVQRHRARCRTRGSSGGNRHCRLVAHLKSPLIERCFCPAGKARGVRWAATVRSTSRRSPPSCPPAHAWSGSSR